VMLMTEWVMDMFWDEGGRLDGVGVIAFAATFGPVFTTLDVSVLMYSLQFETVVRCGSVIVAVALRPSAKVNGPFLLFHVIRYHRVPLFPRRVMANRLPYELIYQILESIDAPPRNRFAELALVANQFLSPSIHLLYHSDILIKNHTSLTHLSRTLKDNERKGEEQDQEEGYFKYGELITSLTLSQCLFISEATLVDDTLPLCDRLTSLSVSCADGGGNWNKLWSYLALSTLTTFVWKAAEEYGRLNGLSLDEDGRESARREESALTTWPTLRSLSLERVYFASAAIRLPPLTPIIVTSPLSSLSLSHCDLPYNFFDLIHFPTLTSLLLNAITGLGAGDFHRFILIHGKNLHSLTLLGTTQDTFARNPVRLDRAAFQCLEKLTKLELSSSATRLDLFSIISPLVETLTLNLQEVSDFD
jgi:hypothetical protein